jgi:hypothetical protein
MKISAMEKTWYMRGQLLRDSDWAGMAHGLEKESFRRRVLLKRWRFLASPEPPTKRYLASISGCVWIRKFFRGKPVSVFRWRLAEGSFRFHRSGEYRPWRVIFIRHTFE